MPYGHVYTFRKELTISNLVTFLQVAAGATAPFIITSAMVTQRGSTTSAQEKLQIVRKNAAATVATATVGTDLFKNRPGDPSPSLQLGTLLSGWQATFTNEGTDGDQIWQDGYNVLNGWVYQPVPEERIHVPAAGIIGLKFPVTPSASQLWEIRMTVMELGT